MRKRASYNSNDPIPPPPLLPPKPVYARAADVSTLASGSGTPPPLPPKPAFARADPRPALPPKPSNLFAERIAPTRPLPLLPIPEPSILEEGIPIPPERSIVSDAITTLPPEPRPFHVDSDILSDGLPDPDDIPLQLELPVAPPLCSLRHAAIPRVFGDPPFRKRDVFALAPTNEYDVRSAAIEIAHNRSRSRGRKSKRSADLRLGREERVICHFFDPSLPQNSQFRAVLDATIQDLSASRSNDSWSPHRPMQLLIGFIIKAALYERERGRSLFAQSLARFRESSVAHVRSAAFTLIINVAAQACFVRGTKDSIMVEGLVMLLFADVVLAMRAQERDKLVWKSALKCALLLYASGDIAPTNLQREALLTLTTKIQPHRHPDLMKTLFEHAERNSVELNKSTHFFREIETSLLIYINTSSLSTRRKLFRAILFAAVDDALSGGEIAGLDNVDQQVEWVRAVLEVHDVANALVLDFRLDSGVQFVPELVRELFFAPLLKPSQQQLDRVETQGTNSDDDDMSSRWGRTAGGAGPFSHNGDYKEDQDSTARAFELSVRRHARAVRTSDRVLHKPFTLRVFQSLGKLAKYSASIRATDDSVAGKAIRRAETACHGLRRAEYEDNASNYFRDLHDATALLVGSPDAPNAAAYISELLIEALFLAPAFAPPSNPISNPISISNSNPTSSPVEDSVAAQFLAGQRYAVRRALSFIDVSLPLALLTLTEPLWSDIYISQCRQCLVEIVGATSERAALLAPFAEDPDTTVAYRAEAVYATYFESDPSSSGSEGGGREKFAREILKKAQQTNSAGMDAYAKALFWRRNGRVREGNPPAE